MDRKSDNVTLPRLGIVLLTSFLLISTGVLFYRDATSPTDENIFTNPPSRLVVTKSFPDTFVNGGGLVREGDLFISINGDRHREISEVQTHLSKISADSQLTLEVIRPQEKEKLEFELQRNKIPANFLRELPPTAYVIEVFEGGASDRAGLKVGDLIYKIDGQSFNSSLEADYILRKARLDKTVIYEIFRENQPLTLEVQLAAVGIRLSKIVLFLTGLFYLATGFWLFWIRPRHKAAIRLGLTGVLFGFYLMVIFSFRGLGTGTPSLIFLLLMLLSLYYGVSFWLTNGFYFPAQIKNISKIKSHERNIYIIAGVATIISWVVVLVYLNFNDFPFFTFIFILIIYYSIVKIRHRKNFPKHYREMNRPIKYSGILVIVGIVLFIVLIEPSYKDIGFVGFILIILPATYMYTIGKYSIMDIRIRVRRNIQYSLISGFWIALLAIITGYFLLHLFSSDPQLPNIRITKYFLEVATEPATGQENQIFYRFFFSIIGLGVVIGSWHLGKLGRKYISRKYYRSQYDYRMAASEMSRMLQTNLDMYELGRELAKKLAVLMHLKRVGVLFFRNQSDCCCQEFYGFDGKEWTEYCLLTQGKIIDAVEDHHKPVNINHLNPELQTRLADFLFEYIIPVRSKEKLVGLMMVGEKLSESVFQHEDLEFLNTVAAQASVSIENAFLYEELREQERLRQELRIARQIQISSLPQKTPKIEGLDIAGISQPATEVGGDFYDFLTDQTNHLLVIVGDVSGKGTSAALYMSKIQGIFHSLYTFDLTPGELFTRVNQILYQDMERTFFVTGLAGKFVPNRKELTLARAGHLPLFHYRSKTGQINIHQPPGIGFGLDPEEIFIKQLKETKVSYESGDVFLFVTDGITETFNKENSEFSEEELLCLLSESAGGSAQQICEYIVNTLEEFSHQQAARDDATVVVIKAL